MASSESLSFEVRNPTAIQYAVLESLSPGIFDHGLCLITNIRCFCFCFVRRAAPVPEREYRYLNHFFPTLHLLESTRIHTVKHGV